MVRSPGQRTNEPSDQTNGTHHKKNNSLVEEIVHRAEGSPWPVSR